MGRGEAPAVGLDQLLSVHRRAETRLTQCTARLESLRAEEQKAMGAEAQALEEQEVAREAAESCGPADGSGEDLQEAFYQACEAAERAAEELAGWSAQRRTAEEAWERAREEVRRAGEDTRPLADKRKRLERSEVSKRLDQGRA